MDKVRERILLVFKHFATNINKLSEGDTALRNRLTRQIKNDAAITIDTVVFILDKFPQLSVDWLVCGKGEMIITILPEGDKDVSPERLFSLESKINTLTEENSKLQAKLDYMEEYNIKIAARLNKAEEALQQYELPKKKNIS